MTETGMFSGYAAIYQRADAGRDSIMPGAFARALKEKPKLPLLWQHNAQAPIGRVSDLSEDANGLRVLGALSLGAAPAHDAWALLKIRRSHGIVNWLPSEAR
jgi:uncharacterized protein